MPESLAYATIAGVPPVVGLYAAVPALALYALLGSSRHLVVSPMSATAALSLSVVAAVATDPTDPAQVLALTTALALATGLVALAAGGLRLGFLAAFISEPVLKGFIIGLALTIMIGQLPALFGVEKGSGNFFEKAWDLIQDLGDAEPAGHDRRDRQPAPAPGAAPVAADRARARWSWHSAASPWSRCLDLEDDGLAIVGHIDSGLPSLGLPDVSVDALRRPARRLGRRVMLVGFAEGLGAAKTYAAKDGLRHRRQQGAARAWASPTSAPGWPAAWWSTAVSPRPPSTASAGAKSQLSPLTAAVLTLVTLLFLTGIFEKLPEATLAAIVIAAVVELVDIASLRRLWRVRTGRLARIYQVTSRADFMGAITAMLGVLIFDTLPGLVIGICVSLLLLLARTSRPHLAVSHRSRRPVPGRTPVRRGSTPSATPTSSRWPACSSYASRRRWSSATRSTCGTGSARSSAR